MCVIEAIYQQRSRLSAFVPSLDVPIFHAEENEEDRLSPKPTPKIMLNSSAWRMKEGAAIPLIKSRTCASAVLLTRRSLIFPYLRPSSIKRKCATSQVRLDTPKMMASRRRKAMAKVAKRIPFPKYPQDLYLTPAFHSWFCSFWLLSVLVKKERTLLPPSPEGVCCFVRCTGLKEESTHVMFAPPFHPVRAERRAAVTFVTSWGAEH